MHYSFTPAAERALCAAARSANMRAEGDGPQLDLPDVLLGLLDEQECRAALLLADKGIGVAEVINRWPHLLEQSSEAIDRLPPFSSTFQRALGAAEEALFEYPRPLALATEHLLLGLAALPGEVSAWLAQNGLTAAALEAEVHRLAGHQPGPLAVDFALESGELIDRTQHNNTAAEPPTGDLGTLRILDAAANRAAEALRVIEDYLRFILDDRHLTQMCKELRHDLAAVLAGIPTAARNAARETLVDVGTELTTAGESSRGGAADVALANFKRLEQALRSLEEYAKTIDAQLASQLKQIRYRAYTLEKAADIADRALERLAQARLYVLLSGDGPIEQHRGLAQEVLEGGADVIQLRSKSSTDREILARARMLVDMTRRTHALLIVNDRPDLAVAAHADGVHLGQDDLSIKDARTIVGPRMLIGVSTHTIEQARQAVVDGADYIGVGPMFPSETKTFAAFPGVRLLSNVAAEIRLPAFAIGGITLDNVEEVFASGGRRIAVSGAVASASDPAAVVRALKTKLLKTKLRPGS